MMKYDDVKQGDCVSHGTLPCMVEMPLGNCAGDYVILQDLITKEFIDCSADDIEKLHISPENINELVQQQIVERAKQSERAKKINRTKLKYGGM